MSRQCRNVLAVLMTVAFAATRAWAAPVEPSGAMPTGFGKISNGGASLPDSAALGPGTSDWACTRHSPSGLVFEVKLPGSGALRSGVHTYSWRSTSAAQNGGVAGTAGAGTCTGSACDTEAYIAAVNASALCGFSNWRLPTRRELQILATLVGQGSGVPVVDAGFFPNMAADGYWSSTSFAANPEAAWSVHFDTGQGRWRLKRTAQRVLLVR
jgi:hypothetical protein